MHHRELIATAFRIGALVIGIPSSVAFAFFGFGAVRLHLLSAQATPAGKSGDALIDLFVSAAHMFGSLFEFFDGAVKWVFTLLSVAAFGSVIFAVLLYFTGRGLHASRGVARAMGILLAVLPLLMSFVAIATNRRAVPLVIASVILTVSAYVIWALGWRFDA